MQGNIAVITTVLLITMVITRSVQLKKIGIKAFKFGEMNKKDFIMPPFALLLLYIIFSNAFNLPRLGTELFKSEFVGWIGLIRRTFHLFKLDFTIIFDCRLLAF